MRGENETKNFSTPSTSTVKLVYVQDNAILTANSRIAFSQKNSSQRKDISSGITHSSHPDRRHMQMNYSAKYSSPKSLN